MGRQIQIIVLDCHAFVPVSGVACISLAVSSLHTITVQTAEDGETVQSELLDCYVLICEAVLTPSQFKVQLMRLQFHCGV